MSKISKLIPLYNVPRMNAEAYVKVFSPDQCVKVLKCF